MQWDAKKLLFENYLSGQEQQVCQLTTVTQSSVPERCVNSDFSMRPD